MTPPRRRARSQPGAAPWLLPNLGAEEGPDWERMLGAPRVATAARLFRELFSSEAQLPARYWPTSVNAANSGKATGEVREAAFDWLAEATGCVAWLADKGAHRTAEAAGLALYAAPHEIVAHTNDKAFALRAAEALGFVPPVLRGTSLVFDAAALASTETTHATLATIRASIAAWPLWARAEFTLKPRFGTSGRGRFDGRADSTGAFDAASVEAALPRLSERGGAILEPWLDRAVDLSAQLHLGADPPVVLLGTLEQRLSRRGGLVGHRGEIDSRGRIFSGLPADEDLREAAAAVAGRALQVGYTGPCGVDAFVFRHPDETGRVQSVLRPIVELNARFTMGLVCIGLVRRHLASVRATLGLRPGERRAFELRIDAPPGGWARARDRAGAGAFVAPLHREADPLRPAILFARSRGDLASALDAVEPETKP